MQKDSTEEPICRAPVEMHTQGTALWTQWGRKWWTNWENSIETCTSPNVEQITEEMCCMTQEAQTWCSVTAQRGATGREYPSPCPSNCFPPSIYQLSHVGEASCPCHEDIQASPWRNLCGKELRRPDNSQQQCASSVRETSWKWVSLPQSSLQLTLALAATSWMCPDELLLNY